jgi:6-phosphofructokinase
MSSKVEFVLPCATTQSERRLLVVCDGGNAPGYSSVTVALTEEGARRGYEVWAATEGFRSLTGDALLSPSQPRFERLIVGRQERYALLARGIPARSMGRRVLDAGSDFRSERYRGFFEREKRLVAAHTIAQQGFTHVVCVGGNGTLEGAKALGAELDVIAPRTRVGFVNVSVDDDLRGDRAIGFFTGVEAGATIARGLYEDAYTHKRVYLLEMMGNAGGRHVLHCGLAARAHLVVLPSFRFDAEVIAELAAALARADHALVVVAEGYERDRCRADGVSASELLRRQLEGAGLRDAPSKRVIAEPFSRYLRGVRPAFADVSAAYLKCSLLIAAFDEGRTAIMPYVLATSDVGLRRFDEVVRDDGVEAQFLPLLARLDLPKFRASLRPRVEPTGRAGVGGWECRGVGEGVGGAFMDVHEA